MPSETTGRKSMLASAMQHVRQSFFGNKAPDQVSYFYLAQPQSRLALCLCTVPPFEGSGRHWPIQRIPYPTPAGIDFSVLCTVHVLAVVMHACVPAWQALSSTAMQQGQSQASALLTSLKLRGMCSCIIFIASVRTSPPGRCKAKH